MSGAKTSSASRGTTDAPQTGRVVAELGRPETPEETAARKAENSRKHRANQTTRNLVASIGASLLVVAFLIFVVARPDTNLVQTVDYRAAAQQADIAEGTALSPVLPSEWSANAAEVRVSGGVTVWYIGFLTPAGQFIGLEQGFDANETWLATHIVGSPEIAATTTDSLTWQATTTPAPSAGNYATVWTTGVGSDDIVLYGTASDEEFRTLATALAAEVTQ
jgi:hypothetical protein